MSDLSNLFKGNTNTLSAASAPLSTVSLSSRAEAKSVIRDSWNASHIESNIRKGVRKELNKEALKEQLKIFRGVQAQAFLWKIIIIFCMLVVVSLVAQFNFALFTSLLLLILAEHSPQLTLLWPIKPLSYLLHSQPILYCIVFYNLLKWSFNQEEHFNWKFILLSIIGTAAYSFLAFYKVFFLFTTRHIVEDLFKLKNNYHKLSFLHKYLIYRGRMMLGIWKYLTLLTFVFSFAVILLFHYFGKFVADVFQPNHILTSLLIFLFLQLFLDSINYGTYCLPKNQKLGNITRDKIPLYINLLRLEYSPSNRTVQLECLKSLFQRCCQVQGFLTTQTTKSLLYNSYMDIFNQFAGFELERIHTAMTSFLSIARKNDKVIIQNKGMIEDLFIYGRKAAAFLHSEWGLMKMMSVLQSSAFLFSIIEKVEAKNEEEEIRIGGRVLGLAKDIRSRLQECTQTKSLSPYTLGELTSYSNSYSKFAFLSQSH